ncbi:metal-dependent hydrolase [Natranaerobius trueperi]|uniref:UPF0173 metal-dependent hydrolase CDO51_00510 n=1 Tax=Natranaerobius trueperi TaxID=759412 RepID=A0A226C158_9FIRM|nr:metal-dependent hydrolase [Natranaerobius trueperi]OWZ84921.1 metal-dependent hydrolase [Natranaerobius trueperi]
MELKFIGHGCVQLSEKNDKLIFDPFIDDNPLANISSDDVSPNYILLSHFHDDHKGDAFQIAKDNDSLIISTAEIAGAAEQEGLKSHPMHIGGTKEFDFGSVKITPALHGSGIAGGHACGFVVNFHGKSIYYAGDTGLFSDMKLISEFFDLDFAILPIGSNFTMDINEAVLATQFLKPKGVIPIHYNTWPPIEADPKEFQQKVSEKTNSECFILDPGESIDIT